MADTDEAIAARKNAAQLSGCTVGLTAQYIAAGRAYETNNGDPALITDPYAEEFAGEYGRYQLDQIATLLPGDHDVAVSMLAGYAALRTKFIDNVMLRCVEEEGVLQVVNLAVGGDSRSHRMPLSEDVKCFDVDLPEVLKLRREVFASVEAVNPDARQSKATCVEVPTDLSKDGWPDQLKSNGFDPSKPSCWIIEGLLMYLPEDVVRSLLETIRDLCKPGLKRGDDLGEASGATSSHTVTLVGDILNTAHFTSEYSKKLLELWTKLSHAPISGFDVPEDLFASLGYVDVEVLEFGDREDLDYGRVPQASKDFYRSVPRKALPETGDPIPRNLMFTVHL